MILENIIRLILREVSVRKEVSIKKFATKFEVSKNEIIEAATIYGLDIREGKIRISDSKKLIFNLLEKGFSLEEVLRYMGWKDLEYICAAFLSINGFETFTNLRFKSSGKRHEIDVIGIKKNKVLLIDCKKWRKYPLSQISRALKDQIERANAFSRIIEKTQVAKLTKFYSEIIIVPAIVTLNVGNIDVQSFNFIIPIYKLKDFLMNFEDFLNNENATIKVHVSKLI